MPSSAEQTPLLECTNHDFLHALDAPHDHDELHDHPPTPQVRKVNVHPVTASLTPDNLGTTASAQSPSLQHCLKQSLGHGFGPVFASMKRQQAQQQRHGTVRTLLPLAVLTMFTKMSVSPVLLVFMNAVSCPDPARVGPCVATAALSIAVPIVSNVLITAVASRYGPGHALEYGALLSAFGLTTVMLPRLSLAVFIVGLALYMSNKGDITAVNRHSFTRAPSLASQASLVAQLVIALPAAPAAHILLLVHATSRHDTAVLPAVHAKACRNLGAASVPVDVLGDTALTRHFHCALQCAHRTAP